MRMWILPAAVAQALLPAMASAYATHMAMTAGLLRRGALLVMVGADDSQTPPSMSRRLFASAGGEADAGFRRLYVAPGIGHASVLSDPQARALYATMLDGLRGDDAAAVAARAR